VIAHTKDQRGCEIIVGNKSHILLWEQSGAAQVEFLFSLVVCLLSSNINLSIFINQFAGLQMREVRNLPDGSLDMSELREKFRPSNPLDYESYTSLVCIENSHNYLGGVVVPLERLDQV